MIRPMLVAFALACAVLISADGRVSAGLIPGTVSVSPDGGNFRWSYAVTLPTEMRLQSGNYFTIYDFNGFVPGTIVAPKGWSVTSNPLGKTPRLLAPFDDPNIPNLTFTYNGPTISTGNVWLGNFSADSVFGHEALGIFAAANNRSQGGAMDQNITQTSVPTGVPEPATLALLGIGLPLVPLLRRKGRRDSNSSSPAA